MRDRTWTWLAIIVLVAIVALAIAVDVLACEPVKIRPTIEFCDVWFWRPITVSDIDFRARDTIYVTNDSGRVCGAGLVKMAFPYVGAMVHVYGDEPMTLVKDGPRNGDLLMLRWSRLPGCGELPTLKPIIYKHWASVLVEPVVPGD